MSQSEDVPPTFGSLLDSLHDRGLIDEATRAELPYQIWERTGGGDEEPWYLQALSGIGAWIAAAFIVAFLSCSGLIGVEGVYPFIWAGIFTGGGVIVHRWFGQENVFAYQLALAVSLVGQGLLVGGLTEQMGMASAFVGYGVASLVLFFAYPTNIHRFLVAFGTLSLAGAAIEDTGIRWAYALLFGVSTLLFCLTFSEDRLIPPEFKLRIRPVGYAAALTLVWLCSSFVLRGLDGVMADWTYAGIAAAGLIFLIYQAARHASAEGLAPVAWGAGTAVALALISRPGVIVALMIIFVGLWRRAHAMLTLGILALTYYLFTFYYSMELNLWSKSLMLIGSGALLLAMRWWFGRRPWFERSKEAA